MQGFTGQKFTGRILSTTNLGGIESNLTTSVRLGTTITANASANTKGNYTTIIASTANIARGIWLIIDTAAAVSNFLFDIATGGAGSETDILSNIYFQRNGTPGSEGFYFPGFNPIAAGTRIAARCQCATGNTAMSVATILENNLSWNVGNSTWVTYGATTATSLGTTVTPGNVAYGAWVSFGATSRDHRIWAWSNSGQSGNNADMILDLAYGPNTSSLTQIVTAAHISSGGITANTYAKWPLYAVGQVPSGSNLWARVASNSTTTITLTIYGN